MSHLLFVDDSRAQELGITGLSGLLVKQDVWDGFCIQLRALKMKLLNDEFAPIKWNPPGNDGFYTAQRSVNRHEILSSICGALGLADVSLLIALIDEGQQRLTKERRLHYSKLSLEFICQRAQMELTSQNGTAQVIADLPGTGQEGSLSRHFTQIRRLGSSYPGFDIKLDRLNRSLYLSHDYMCEGLQAADFVIGSAFAALKGRDSQYFNLIKSKVRRKHTPEQVKGYGIVVYPSHSTTADSLCNMCLS